MAKMGRTRDVNAQVGLSSLLARRNDIYQRLHLCLVYRGRINFAQEFDVGAYSESVLE